MIWFDVGPYLCERVPMVELNNLIKKLETRLDITNFCKLNGCDDCSTIKRPPQETKSSVRKTDNNFNNLSSLRRLARKGGCRTATEDVRSRSKKGVYYFAEDHIKTSSLASSGVFSSVVMDEKEETEEKLMMKKRARGVQNDVKKEEADDAKSKKTKETVIFEIVMDGKNSF